MIPKQIIPGTMSVNVLLNNRKGRPSELHWASNAERNIQPVSTSWIHRKVDAAGFLKGSLYLEAGWVELASSDRAWVQRMFYVHTHIHTDTCFIIKQVKEAEIIWNVCSVYQSTKTNKGPHNEERSWTPHLYPLNSVDHGWLQTLWRERNTSLKNTKIAYKAHSMPE